MNPDTTVIYDTRKTWPASVALILPRACHGHGLLDGW